jgi:peroxiredoxin
MIPGARGCTPQSRSFRDHFNELRELGVDHLFGLSTQDTTFSARLQNGFTSQLPLLSDESLELPKLMGLPRQLVPSQVECPGS